MSRNRKIYLIGFMGSGKTTAGRQLASNLRWSFIDLDKKIEEHAGEPITQIFSNSGEEYFRMIESDMLKNIAADTPTVISTGGGAPCWGNNMDFMIETGITVYLKLSPSELKDRLEGSHTERPLLKGFSGEDLLQYITEKLSLREGCYNRADIVYEGKDVDIDALSALIKPYLQT